MSLAAVTLEARAASYARAFPQCARSVWTAGDVRRGWLYGVWQIGNDYRNPTTYYGTYPRTYLRRVRALFPEITDRREILHAFAGKVRRSEGVTIDIARAVRPEIVGSVYDVARLTRHKFALVMADPPYTAKDAERYGCAMVNRGRAMRALSTVTRPGGFVVWLDTVWPMHRKAEWIYVGAIMVIRSTNHRVRVASMFQRRGGR